MKVTIKDKDALQALRVKHVKSYVESKGWKKIEESLNTYTDESGNILPVSSVYSQEEKSHIYTSLTIPNAEHFADYSARMSELLMNLEKFENRSQLEIYVDITQRSFVIRPKKLLY